MEVLERQHVQLLVVDRPGYGRSTRWPRRRIADVGTDVRAVADLHGWNRFAVWGGPGGGPHALACASLLPDRVEWCASVVGPAPYGGGGLTDWFNGMSRGGVVQDPVEQELAVVGGAGDDDAGPAEVVVGHVS